jgi:hypothetical protein
LRGAIRLSRLLCVRPEAMARERQAREAQRQRESFERLDQAALLSARVQLDPSPTNRARLRAFLTLMAQRPLQDGDGDALMA